MDKVYVGIDISKLTFDVAIKDISGAYKHNVYENNPKGFQAFTKLLQKGVSVCVMEASGPYYLKLATFLVSNNIDVCVINPLVIKRFCQMKMVRTKTDKKDAIMISQYGYTEQPAPWEPEADYVLELKQMQSFLEQLHKSKTGFIRQKEAFKQNPIVSKTTLKGLTEMIIGTEKQIRTIELEMEKIIKQHHNQMFEHLQSIPGLGKKTSLFLIVISGGFEKFHHHKQLASYIGIAPRIFESGTSVKGRSRICKMGMSKIRGMLYVCSWSAIRYNKACKALYERLVEKGKSKKLALVAVINKLLKQAFAVATKKEFYNESFA